MEGLRKPAEVIRASEEAVGRRAIRWGFSAYFEDFSGAHLGGLERKQLEVELERARAQMVVSRPAYVRPDYFRLITILLHRLRRGGYADIEREIEAALSEVEKGIRANHFPKYPSPYVKNIRALLVEAARSEGVDRSRLSRIARRCQEVTEAVYSYE